MKQHRQHKKIRSPLVRILLRTLKFFIDITVFSLRVNKNQDRPTTHDLMIKLAKQDPALFDQKPLHNRSPYER